MTAPTYITDENELPASDERPLLPDDNIPYTTDERNAMRTYIQRCEVRMSTLHRIATAFVGGAGLLLLIPIFLRDVVTGVIIAFLGEATRNFFPEFGDVNGLAITLVFYLLLLYPMMLSLFIPLYGTYLLLKDIVHFYFTLYMPGFPTALKNPTFSLTGIAFSEDESPRVKRAVMRYQYESDHMHFMMGFSEGKRKEYFDNIIQNTGGAILPLSRSLDKLKTDHRLPEHYKEEEVRRFNAAFGIARSIDRSLVEEVAVTEMALVRAILYLRRLVLRYAKTLLMFIWTTMIAFFMLPLIQDREHHVPALIVIALGYLVWSLAVVGVMRTPLSWIYRHRGGINTEHVDVQLRQLEGRVHRLCYAAIVSSFLGLLMAFAAYF